MIKILLLTFTITISLLARLNPFEPVINKVDLDKTKLHPIVVKYPIHTLDDGKRTVKITAQEDEKPKSRHIIMVKEKIVEQPLTKKQLIEKCKVLKKDILPKKKNIIVKTKKVIKNKKLKKFIPKKYKVLPFLTIHSKKKSIIITTRKKYKLIRYYLEQNEKKFVFDFKGKVISYTKRKNLNAPYFKKYIVGNHSEDEFFRVVIQAKKNTNKYTVSTKNNIVTIIAK